MSGRRNPEKAGRMAETGYPQGGVRAAEVAGGEGESYVPVPGGQGPGAAGGYHH